MDEIKLSAEKKADILKKVEELLQLYHNGALGGEVMPEDANPGLGRETSENYSYFTLPMALNYKRNFLFIVLRLTRLYKYLCLIVYHTFYEWQETAAA